ncbi:hypothetical protein ACFY1U_46060 [Streptomyces sp. NPDC001351]|uniref:hypothetical protein n=1 Tax=Streptomyces sp. NPDC001351 TaxID=3364564 RepID=UPI003681AFEA
MATISAALAAALPDLNVAIRVLSGPLAVVAATGFWQALRSDRSRSGKHLALSFACALGSFAVLVALRSMA